MAEYKTLFVKAAVSNRRTVQGKRLAKSVENASNKLAQDGYTVISVAPVISGDDEMLRAGGPGWSYTSGMVIVGSKP